ncbi:permease [Fusobacterium sp. PH5-44]|uniref:permease n=1 Tax=unclassified Fusobacterium TaxID=2648384 RepID=UPI003D1E5C39
MRVISTIWNFFENQFLKMLWLDHLVEKFLVLIGLDPQGKIGGSVQFFIYDTIKIIILLSTLIFVISYIQSFFPPERTKKILGNFKGIKANTLSALLGTVTPFCSCSSIPLFIGFTNAGLSLGVTFSFLISSPLVDIGSFILLISVFGLKIAIIYVIIGIILAVIGGTIIEKLGMEKYVVRFNQPVNNIDIESPELTRKDRLSYSYIQSKETLKKVFWYIIIGVGIGALIHNWIPTDIIQKILGSGNPFSVLIATFVGLPMYADIFGTIPIAEALFAKGVGIGTILSFMMGVTALSLPSIIMLKNVVKGKLLVLFVSIVAIGIIIIGYAFNAFSYLLV